MFCQFYQNSVILIDDLNDIINEIVNICIMYVYIVFPSDWWVMFLSQIN